MKKVAFIFSLFFLFLFCAPKSALAFDESADLTNLVQNGSDAVFTLNNFNMPYPGCSNPNNPILNIQVLINGQFYGQQNASSTDCTDLGNGSFKFVYRNLTLSTASYLFSVCNYVYCWDTGNYSYSANQPPSVNQISNATINEGDTYSASGSFTDSDSTSWTATVDYGDGSGSQALTLSGTNFSLSHVYKDNGTYTVTVSVTDNQGATGTRTATITVNNVAPTVGTITVATSPVQVNSSITASANFTDPGVLDTHTASWNWGDGNTTSGTVTEANGSGSVSNSHTYSATGVYTVTLTVTDKDGGAGSATYQYVAVYDPSAGFLGASGKYTSQAGWDTQNTSATGDVKFGIQAKYQNGNTPTGHNKITFKAGNLDFDATSYNWLVVSGAKATLEGNGTINGTGNYNFLVSAIDGSQSGGQNLVRVKITDSSNNVIYDTQSGAADSADPTTSLTNGSIKIHN